MKKIYLLFIGMAVQTLAMAQCAAVANYTVDGMTVTVDGQVSGANSPVSIISWINGDPTSPITNAEDGSYTYTQPGTYEVCLVYYDNDNLDCSAGDCFIVTVPQAASTCSVSLTTNTVGLQAFAVAVGAGATGQNTEIYIDWGDGNLEPGSTLQHTYAQPGTYTVCAHYSDLDDPTGCTAESCNVITVTDNSSSCSVEVTFNDLGNNTYGVSAVGTGASVPSYGINWGDGSAVQFGATGTHTYTNPGTFTLCVAYYDAMDPNGCSDLQCSVITVTDIAEIKTPIGSFSVAPNPAQDWTTITTVLNQNTAVNLIVYDMLGNQVEELINGRRSSGENKLQWDISNIPSGVYFIRLSTPNEQQTLKFIRQ